MEPNISQKIEELSVEIKEVYKSVEKMRNYFKWTLYVTIALFVLPLIGLVFAVPAFLNNYLGTIQSLTQ